MVRIASQIGGFVVIIILIIIGNQENAISCKEGQMQYLTLKSILIENSAQNKGKAIKELNKHIPKNTWMFIVSEKDEFSPRTGHTLIRLSSGLMLFGGMDDKKVKKSFNSFKGKEERRLFIQFPDIRLGDLRVHRRQTFSSFRGKGVSDHRRKFRDFRRISHRRTLQQRIVLLQCQKQIVVFAQG